MNKNRLLFVLALLVSTYLSVTLLHLGIDKFYYILVGGKKFATFPDLRIQLGIGLSYVFISILYLIWIGKHFQDTPPAVTSRFRDVLKSASPFLVLAFIAYPLGNDIYIYLHSGLMNLNRVNPFVVRAAAFSTELSPYVDWGQTSTYGLVSQAIFTVSAAFVAVHPLVAVYVYKAICLALHTLNGFLIWKWLPHTERHRVAIAYLLHPLLLMEQVSSGHVDLLVSTSLIAFAISYAKWRYWTAFTALWMGLLAKTLPLIWVPLMAIAVLRRGQGKQLFRMISASIAIVGVLTLTILPNVSAWRSLLNPGVEGQFQSSLLAIARFLLDITRIFIAPEWLSFETGQAILLGLVRLTILGFIGFYAWRLWRSDRYWDNTPQKLLEEMGWVTLVLLLIATPWLMPWYSSILITFAALLPRARLFGLTSLAFGLSSSAQYVLASNSSIKSFVSIGLPIAVLIIGSWLLRRRSPTSEVVVTSTNDPLTSENSSL
ncbi:MAG: hypothetical protein KME43_06610 [Myxacorys chilensis ATA2-1-KO14]|nr:hypothetical protein [Myxacorys chilensis ATA2-1-KO14]